MMASAASNLWQIVFVPARLRAQSAHLPLIIRAFVILFCALTTVYVASHETRSGHPLPITLSGLALTAALLVLVAGFASLPMPSSVPAVVAPLAETLAASIVVGALGRNGTAFLIYLLVPVFIGGLTAGVGAGLTCSALAVFVPIAATLAAKQATASWNEVAATGPSWLFIVVAVGLLGGWMRLIRESHTAEGEPAYTDAHRLLSELHVVARQLSLGLDPQTLAAALVEDIRAVLPHGDVAVLARSGAGRFVALVGAEPADTGEGAVRDAWLSAQPVRRQEGGASVAALPVTMGERVVALVSVIAPQPMDRPALARCQAVIHQSGPRLASAMLFEDVRRVATVDERMRLAREIHDGIAQDLASVGYALDDIGRDSGHDVAGRVVAVRDKLTSMVGDLRLSIFALRSGADESIPLATALSEYAQRAGSQTGLVVHASVDESPRRLPVAVEVELLRMTQEAVTNVRKHAQASNLWLTVTVEPPNAHITVLDDGRGMGAARPDSYGLAGMRERAARIGAQLAVRPGPEGGTLVEIWLGARAQTGPIRAPVAAMTRKALTDPHGMPSIGTHVTLRPTPGRANQEVT